MKPIKILIVEDELLIAQGLSRKLQKLGYAVVGIVSSGEAALAIIPETHPDLVLMDIVIKGEMDGIETAAKVHDRYQIPVVYVTAYADDRTLDRAKVTGSYGYILKPFKERELIATIEMAIEKHKEQCFLRELLVTAEAMVTNKSRLVALASHDLRTPLTAIRTSAELLQHYHHKLNEEKKVKHFDRIQTSISNMTQLLDDLLLFSKAESGKLSCHPVLLDVVQLSQKLFEEISPLAGPQHALKFSCKGECSQAKYDEKLLCHILTNLLSNAIKYSPKGGQVTFEVSCDEDYTTFRIQDEGIGIPQEYQERLFEAFERAENVGSISGTGLGLSIVRQAVELHGGEISVESEVGAGSTFIIKLPKNL